MSALARTRSSRQSLATGAETPSHCGLYPGRSVAAEFSLGLGLSEHSSQLDVHDEGTERYRRSDNSRQDEPCGEWNRLSSKDEEHDERDEEHAVDRSDDRHRNREIGVVLERHSDEEKDESRDSLDEAAYEEPSQKSLIEILHGSLFRNKKALNTWIAF